MLLDSGLNFRFLVTQILAPRRRIASGREPPSKHLWFLCHKTSGVMRCRGPSVSQSVRLSVCESLHSVDLSSFNIVLSLSLSVCISAAALNVCYCWILGLPQPSDWGPSIPLRPSMGPSIQEVSPETFQRVEKPSIIYLFFYRYYRIFGQNEHFFTKIGMSGQNMAIMTKFLAQIHASDKAKQQIFAPKSYSQQKKFLRYID